MNKIKKYLLQDNASIKDALIALNNLSNDVQTLFVINNDKKLIGTITDGDIRRGLISGRKIEDSVYTVFNKDYKFIYEDSKDLLTFKEYKSENIELLPCLNKELQIVNIYNLRKIKSILPIDAVLMAGGKGERLRPLTEKIPKPLLKVGNKAIIDYNIESLISYGVKNINVTINYLSEQIEDHFKNPINLVHIKCVKEPKFYGTIGSVKFVDGFKNDVVLVMNSDLFTNIDFEKFYLDFIENNADISIASIPYTVNIPFGIFDINNEKIKGLLEKPSYNYYANAGIYLIKKQLLDLIPENTFYNATDFIELLISKKYKVIKYPITGFWIDIGKHEDYKKAQEFVKHIDINNV